MKSKKILIVVIMFFLGLCIISMKEVKAAENIEYATITYDEPIYGEQHVVNGRNVTVTFNTVTELDLNHEDVKNWINDGWHIDKNVAKKYFTNDRHADLLCLTQNKNGTITKEIAKIAVPYEIDLKSNPTIEIREDFGDLRIAGTLSDHFNLEKIQENNETIYRLTSEEKFGGVDLKGTYKGYEYTWHVKVTWGGMYEIMYMLYPKLSHESNIFKIGENITDCIIFRDESTGKEFPINWEDMEIINEVDNGVIEINGSNAVVKREGDSVISYKYNYEGEEHGFTLEVTAVGNSTTIIGNPKVYMFMESPLIKTQENETEEVFTYLDMKHVNPDSNGFPEVDLEWQVENSEIAELEETTKYFRGIVIKPKKRGNTKLTCTVKILDTGETIVKTAYIMVADEN